MSRLQPYRNKIPTHIIKLLDVSSRITLFLVGQNGPLSFIFKDRLQNKYKTLIGSDVKCTCSPNKNDHCIHSLYVLLKIFKISVENPIIWQASYIDSELSDIISGKYTVLPVRQRIARPNFEIQNQTQILPSDFYFKKQIIRNKRSSIQNVKPLNLEEDSVCPICQQQMKKDMCLTYCKVGCGNNYHLECLKVWISHKKNEESKLTCPMCRQEFHIGVFQQIKSEEMEWKKKQMVRKFQKYQCNSCGIEQIPKKAHKCILCTKFQLCEACYLANKHIKHPFMRRNEVGQWQAADERRAGELKIKQFIDSKRKQSKNKQIIEKLRQSKKLSLLDFICSAYPYVSKYISDNIDPFRKLNLQPETMECFKCGSKRMIFLRRLPCGHFIDHECLKENIRKGVTYCEKDGDKLVKGYENMLEQQRELKYEQEKIQIQVDGEFAQIQPQSEEIENQQNLVQRSQFYDDMQGDGVGLYDREQVLLRENLNNNNREQQANRYAFGDNGPLFSVHRRLTTNEVHRMRPPLIISREKKDSVHLSNGRSTSRKSHTFLNLILANPFTQNQIKQPQIPINQNPQKKSSNHTLSTDRRVQGGIIRRTQIINSLLPNIEGRKNKRIIPLNSNHPFFANC